MGPRLGRCVGPFRGTQWHSESSVVEPNATQGSVSATVHNACYALCAMPNGLFKLHICCLITLDLVLLGVECLATCSDDGTVRLWGESVRL